VIETKEVLKENGIKAMPGKKVLQAFGNIEVAEIFLGSGVPCYVCHSVN
jgi:hypothetical protein